MTAPATPSTCWDLADSLAVWQSALVAAGFAVEQACFRLDGIEARIQSPWIVFETSRRSENTRGFWKPIGERARFDIPMWAASAGDVDLGDDAVAPLIDWALATREGRVAPDARVTKLIRREDLGIHTDGLVREIKLVSDSSRVVAIVQLVNPPADLPVERTAAITALLEDAQCRFRVARFERDDTSGGITCQVDLTGAPQVFISPAIQALKLVTSACLPTFEWLCDPHIFLPGLREAFFA